MKRSKTWLAASIALAALAWGGSAAHLLELPNMLELGRDDYLVARGAYRAGSLFGWVALFELVAAGTFAWISRHERWRGLAATALVCVIATQVLFWAITFPVDRMTASWTSLPVDWERLRAQWEYSRAASAILNLGALGSLLAAMVRMPTPTDRPTLAAALAERRRRERLDTAVN